ncbi:MAG TPA: hypothetical protein PKY31_03225 [Spirochaetota bacterium]|nr:hypothetical protein [Spirochaetota bacterium]
MCHRIATPLRSDTVSVTQEERRILSGLIEDALDWSLYTRESRVLKGLLAKVRPDTEAAQ